MPYHWATLYNFEKYIKLFIYYLQTFYINNIKESNYLCIIPFLWM